MFVRGAINSCIRDPIVTFKRCWMATSWSGWKRSATNRIAP